MKITANEKELILKRRKVESLSDLKPAILTKNDLALFEGLPTVGVYYKIGNQHIGQFTTGRISGISSKGLAIRSGKAIMNTPGKTKIIFKLYKENMYVLYAIAPKYKLKLICYFADSLPYKKVIKPMGDLINRAN